MLNKEKHKIIGSTRSLEARQIKLSMLFSVPFSRLHVFRLLCYTEACYVFNYNKNNHDTLI